MDVLLSCDTANEIDDQFAITYALFSDDIDVRGIVSTQNNRVDGENSVSEYQKEAEKIVDLIGRDVPCIEGNKTKFSAKEDSGIIDRVEDIIEGVEGELKIVCTGPLTDAAYICQKFTEQEFEVIWLGGYSDNFEIRKEGELKEDLELNLGGDLNAARFLLNSEDLDTLIPAKGVAEKMITLLEDFKKRLEKKDSEISSYLINLLDSRDTTFWILWDLAAIAYLKDTGIVETKKEKIELSEGFFTHSRNGDIKVVQDINEFEIRRDFIQTIR